MNPVTAPDAGGLSEALYRLGVVPVVSVSRAEQATRLARALRAGGLACIEIAFRSDAAAAAIERVREELPDMLVGAGTVLTTAQADSAIAAGAKFVVAPGFNPAVVEHVRGRGVTMLPGVCTPSEVEQALARDIQLMKLFPAAPMGGVDLLRSLAGPYPMVRFVPTGGITPSDLAAYLALASVVAVGGTWLAKPETVRAGDWGEIERLAASASATVREVRGADAALGDRADPGRPA